jgi:hypothetical protein
MIGRLELVIGHGLKLKCRSTVQHTLSILFLGVWGMQRADPAIANLITEVLIGRFMKHISIGICSAGVSS